MALSFQAMMIGRQDGAASVAPIRLRTLTVIRWVAVAGQAVAILVTHFLLGFSLPLFAALSVVAASALLNLGVACWQPGRPRLGERSAAWHLAYDIVQLSVLLYLTGGLENPFSFLLLAPLTVSATILSVRSTVALSTLTVACTTALAAWHMPLPWGPGGLDLPATYVLGSWVALTLGIVFFAAYTSRVAGEARRMSDALAATQLALAREQQLSALGGLAAAAAHDLGSPLGTIAVAAREIARELPPDSPIADDIELLISETARCRDILAELARSPAADDDGPFGRLPIDVVVEAAAASHASERVTIEYDARASDGTGGGAPSVMHRAEIIHGLGNLVQNAVQFAAARVRIMTRWSDTDIAVTIRDDGAGFPAKLMEKLGEPYVSDRETEDGHMGLGIFIAQTLLQRTGATLEFANVPEGGAEVVVRWKRQALEDGGIAVFDRA